MTSRIEYSIRNFDFSTGGLKAAREDPDDADRLKDWPVVYVLHAAPPTPRGKGLVYVGQSEGMIDRFGQHLNNPEKRELKSAAVILDDTFNRSVCEDLESYLIKLSSGDESNRTLNGNAGQQEKNYFSRDEYRRRFASIFEQLHKQGIFSKSVHEIENSEMFKYSPFKALNEEQLSVIIDITERLEEDLADSDNTSHVAVIRGDPGTGKTIVSTFLMKLLSDIGNPAHPDEEERDAVFEHYFLPDVRALFRGLKIGFVVPMQGLNETLTKVFKATPGLSGSMILKPTEVGESTERFDVLIVDEAHRLSQFGSQASGPANTRMHQINESLFDGSNPQASQLDWIRAQARNVILLVDTEQTVRPLDISKTVFTTLLENERTYHLKSQMRSVGGKRYIDYTRSILSAAPPAPPDNLPKFGRYSLGIVDDPKELIQIIRDLDAEYELSRLVAGYGWEWKSKHNKTAFDITLGNAGEEINLRWNTEVKDWINSPNALDEVGSIHTIQGHDLNYAGVIFGPELRYDLETEQLKIFREHYHDKKGKANNKMAGQVTTDADLFQMITNAYYVMMTRGINGTFIHVVDPGLREYLGRYFPVIRNSSR